MPEARHEARAGPACQIATAALFADGPSPCLDQRAAGVHLSPAHESCQLTSQHLPGLISDALRPSLSAKFHFHTVIGTEIELGSAAAHVNLATLVCSETHARYKMKLHCGTVSI